MKKILYILSLLVTMNVSAQHVGPLRVIRSPHGFELRKQIQGHDVLLAYSDEGDFDQAMQSDTLFRRMIHSYYSVKKLKPLPLITSAGIPSEVAPLCTDLWHQDEPYHNFTPLIDDQHAKVGCVATSMAQIMYYYHYPEKGTGTHTYFDEKGCGDTLTADFSAHTYDWDYILDAYDTIGHSERQLQAIAQLHSDCGIAVDMRYGISDSGASSALIAHALYNYFGYSPSMRFIFRDFYRHDELHAILRNELANGRPIACGAHLSDGSGHAFIIDGYDTQGLYHINWGWGGWCNGYYNIDYMNPDQPEWYHDPDRMENGLNMLQNYTIGIQPADRQPIGTTPDITHEYAFSHIELLDTTSTIVVHNLGNIGWNEHQGRVSLVLTQLESDEVISPVYDYRHRFMLEEIADTTYTDTIRLQIPDNIPYATYRLMPMFYSNGIWTRARTSCGTPYFIYVDHKPDGIHLRQPQGAIGHLQLTDFKCPDTISRRTFPHITLTLQNNSDEEYCGRVYLTYEAMPNAPLLQLLTRVGLYLQPHETRNIDFRYQYIGSQVPDTLYLHVLYDVDLFSDSIVFFDKTAEAIVIDESSNISPQLVDHQISTNRNYDTGGRPLTRPFNHQIIITEDGKKRSFQNVP